VGKKASAALETDRTESMSSEVKNRAQSGSSASGSKQPGSKIPRREKGVVERRRKDEKFISSIKRCLPHQTIPLEREHRRNGKRRKDGRGVRKEKTNSSWDLPSVKIKVPRRSPAGLQGLGGGN